MTTYIALFRRINLGGRNVLPMKALVAVLENLGCEDVKTCIQSGNAVFRCRKLSPAQMTKKLTAAITAGHGFAPAFQFVVPSEVAEIAASNPFPEAEAEPNTLHVFFLESTPKKPDLDGLEETRAPNERLALTDKAFYLHAPDGIGRSKLAASVEARLGVPATSRNWRTLGRVLELAREFD